ncbi:MAG: hypothetical protein KDD82_27325 [Planctomycetes bacterium]|nr:hypothetical protein [Planctomycetota bacterium]
MGGSKLLTLCVHDDHVGFEFSWQPCCETAACCERAAPVESHDPSVGSHDGCEDYALDVDVDWAPSAAVDACPTPWGLVIGQAEQARFVSYPCKPLPAAPSRAPPPDRSLRTVHLRC